MVDLACTKESSFVLVKHKSLFQRHIWCLRREQLLFAHRLLRCGRTGRCVLAFTRFATHFARRKVAYKFIRCVSLLQSVQEGDYVSSASLNRCDPESFATLPQPESLSNKARNADASNACGSLAEEKRLLNESDCAESPPTLAERDGQRTNIEIRVKSTRN